MTFLNRILEPPTYGFSRDGALVVPTRQQILREFFSRCSVFASKKNWLPFFGWTVTGALTVAFFVFISGYFSWPLFAAGMVYSMVCLGTHGTIWLHRYCTHRGYQFSAPIWRTVCRNLVIRIIPEEIYVVSHHVHHQLTEKPGDPYNVHGGWLYCFLADVNHQLIARNLTEKDYAQLCRLMGHTGVKLNTFEQYQKWGSLAHPFWSVAHYAANWAFWYGLFFMMGGHALATALFGMSAVWAIGVRTYNFDGHGRGKDQRREGVDFNWDDLSINQLWPGYVASEWHNNHHLYPNGARSGFLPHQVDLAWLFICAYRKLGGIQSVRDYKADFLRDYYHPWLESKRTGIALPHSLRNPEEESGTSSTKDDAGLMLAEYESQAPAGSQPVPIDHHL